MIAEARKALARARADEVRLITCNCGIRWVTKLMTSPLPTASDDLLHDYFRGFTSFQCLCGLHTILHQRELVYGLEKE
jgi:hypothetical protein